MNNIQLTGSRNGESHNKDVRDAALRALKTGNAKDILPWVPEEHENKVKNLFERTLCEQRLGKDSQNVAVELYFATILQICNVRDPSQRNRR
mgnify:CR=1 FL=1